MSDTPRTDAWLSQYYPTAQATTMDDDWIAFARQLERELRTLLKAKLPPETLAYRCRQCDKDVFNYDDVKPK